MAQSAEQIDIAIRAITSGFGEETAKVENALDRVAREAQEAADKFQLMQSAAADAAAGTGASASKMASAMSSATGKIKTMPEQFSKVAAGASLVGSATSGMGGAFAQAGNKAAGLLAVVATGGPLGIAIAGVTAVVSAGALVWDTYKQSMGGAKEMAASLAPILEAGASAVDQYRTAVEGRQKALAQAGMTAAERANDDANAMMVKYTGAYERISEEIEKLNDKIIANTTNDNRELGLDLVAVKTLEKKRQQFAEMIRLAKEDMIITSKLFAQEQAAQKRTPAAKQGGRATEITIDWNESELTAAVDQAMADGAEQLRAAIAETNASIDYAAEVHFGYIQQEMAKAGDWLVSDVQAGTTTLAGDIYNAMARVSPKIANAAASVAEGISSAAKRVASAAKSAAGKYGDAITSSMGEVGGVIQGVAQRLKDGDAIGAILALVLSVLQKSKSFQWILSALGEVLGFLGEAINPIAALIKPIIQAFIVFSEFVMKSGITFSLITPIIEGLGWVIQRFTDGLIWVVTQIASFFNWMIEQVAKVIGWFSDGAADKARKYKIDTSSMGMSGEEKAAAEAREAADADMIKRLKDEIKYVNTYGNKDGAQNGAIDSLAEQVKRYTLDLDPGDPFRETIAALVDELMSLKTATEDAVGGMHDASEEANGLGESLHNVPSGYKVALARFGATSAIGGAGPELALAAAGGTSVSIQQVHIHSNGDARELWARLKPIMRGENLARTGSAISATAASPYTSARRTR